MDPDLLRALLVSSTLVVGPASANRPTLHALVAPTVPVSQWPAHSERPDSEHPGHGEGSDESAIFVGAVYTNTSAVTVDSGASGTTSGVLALWPGNNFQMVASTRDLDEPFFLDEQLLRTPRGTSLALPVRPQTKRFFRDAMTRRSVGTRSGR